MADVRLDLYLPQKRNSSPHTFTLESLDVKTDSAALTFNATEHIHDGHSQVYRGLLSGYASHGIKAVCKFATRTPETIASFNRETEVYQDRLRDMQGLYIPRFYGLYVGSIRSQPTICLLLEDCGTSPTKLFDLKLPWRIKLTEIFLALHKRNIQHNDFRCRNLVVDNLEKPTRLVVIDFERATDHVCQRKGAVSLYFYPPLHETFGCNELYAVADATEVWTPESVPWFGSYVDIESISCIEDFLKFVPDVVARYGREVVLKAAEDLVERWTQKYHYRESVLKGEAYKALEPIM